MEARLDHIDRREALAYLGYRGVSLAEDAEADMARCEALILETARPRAVWRRFALLPDGTLAGTGFRPEGGDVRRLLSGCHDAILMAATLGGEVDALLRRAQVMNMADALMLDACASAAVENVCDNLCADLAAALQRSCGSSRPCGMTSCLWATQMDDPAKAVKNNGIIA